jgi:hypothetical protein
VEQQLVSKRQGKFSKGISFLQDNAAPHKTAMTHQKLAHLGFEVLQQPACSPDFTPQENVQGGKIWELRGPHQLRTGGLQNSTS